MAFIRFKAISQSLAILFLSFPIIYGLISIKAHGLALHQAAKSHTVRTEL